MRNFKYKAIIFDMDGTIINSESLWKRAFLELIKERNITIQSHKYNQLYNQLRGMDIEHICTIIKKTFKLNEPLDRLVQESCKKACKLFEQEIAFYDGFLDFYDCVKNLKLKYAIATNADDQSLAVAKRVLALEKYFGKHIYNIYHVNNKPKPNPAVYVYTAKQLGVDPTQCIAIEDSAHGVQAAQSAGMFCIGYNSSKNRALIDDADLIVDAYDHIDLERLLLK